MWLCLNNAFLSIVHKDCAPDELTVRARRRGDIERVFPGASVREGGGTDYPFRTVVARSAVVEAMSRQVEAIDYGNFKSSVDDHALHDAYMDVWHAMSRVQRTNGRQKALF